MIILKNKRKYIIFITIINIFIMSITYISYALSKYGSSGNEVSTIQEKLKRWGYYEGEVDGKYGSLTQQAVKNFQESSRINC